MNCYFCDRAVPMCADNHEHQKHEEKKKNISSGEDAWVDDFQQEWEEQRSNVLA